MMRTRLALVVTMLFGLAAIFGGAAPALAEERRCVGTIGAVRLDNIFVPDNQTCTLNGTSAIGTLKVGTGATLYANGVRINGNIQAEGARLVVVRSGSWVGGSVQIKQGRAATIDSVRINGDLQFDQNREALRANGTVIGGNLQAFKNTGGLTITNNRIAQNMQCKENSPAPSGGNNIAGSKEDQCARL